jgi:glycosyltransferase involved in cell wall biosynthesis
MGEAYLLVLPSEWYETFGRVAIESFARGTPVVAAGLGAIAEIVADRATGLHFRPGDAADLAAKVEWAWEHPGEMAEMGNNARRDFERKYSREPNYERLMEIYEKAIEHAQGAISP